MLSDVTSAQDAKREISADTADDFEWVNAWAAATSPQTSTPPACEAVPQGTALVQELAHIQPKEQRAPEPTVADGVLPIAAQPESIAAEPVATSADLVADIGAVPMTNVEVDREQETIAEAAPSAGVLTSDGPNERGAPISVVPETEAAITPDENAPAVAPELVELVDEQSPQDDTKASFAPISFLDFARRAKPWRSLFGIAARQREPQPEIDTVDSLEALPNSGDPVAVDAATFLELAPAIAPDQLESDIGEIELRRDALLAEWEQERRMTAATAAPAARSRTTDYVPILLGCVLGFTLVVVFGAAASFVSLR
jgi:hypothetical protein